MSGLLRAGRAASRLSTAAPKLQTQQTRSVGDLPVKPDRYIEQWGTYREHIPISNGFTWNARTLTRIAIWAGAVPFLLYSVTSAEFHHTDAKYKRKQREFF